ncbi:hypothetical protein ACCB44_06260, partial [Staphylococcus aureus]
MINLSNRVKAMEDFKMSFNNEFSTNQIFFNPSFVMETIAIINEYQKDISYLKNGIGFIRNNQENSSLYFLILNIAYLRYTKLHFTN